MTGFSAFLDRMSSAWVGGVVFGGVVFGGVVLVVRWRWWQRSKWLGREDEPRESFRRGRINEGRRGQKNSHLSIYFLPSGPEWRPIGEPRDGAEEKARGARSRELRATHSSLPSIGSPLSPAKERRARQRLPPSAPRGGSQECTWLRRPRRKKSRGRASWRV